MSLGRAIVWFGAAYGVAIGGYLVLNAAAGRMLGPDSFGYFVAALTLTTVMGQIGLVGVHRSGLREASRLQREDVEQLAELRRGVRAVTLVSLPLAGLVTGVITWFVTANAATSDRVVLALSTTALVVLNGLQKLWANYLRGFGQVRLASMLEGRSGGAVVALCQAVLVWLVWRTHPSWGLAGALAAVVVGFAIPVGLAGRAVTRYWGHAGSQTRILRDLRQVIQRDWRFASVQVAALLNSSVEIWIAGFLLTSADTSMLGAAQRLSQLVVLPMTALGVVFSPSISRLAVGGPRADLERLMRTGATMATAVTTVMWLPLVLVPGQVLRLVFGPGFGAATVPVVLLSTAFMVNAITGLAGLGLSMAHREGVAARVQWSALIVRVLLGTAVAALLGLDALAVSATVVSAGMFVVMWSRARRILGVNTGVTTRPDLSIVRGPAGVAG